MPFETISKNVIRFGEAPQVGELAEIWKDFGADVVVAHPWGLHPGSIAKLLAAEIRAAGSSFSGRKVCFLVADSRCTPDDPDDSVLEAALDGAEETLEALGEEVRARVHVVVAPFVGYRGNLVVGRGSAQEMIFEEMAGSEAVLLLLLDGDLENDLASWQGIFSRLEAEHRVNFEGRPMLVLPRFSRHFLADGFERFLLAPLTSLIGRQISGLADRELVLSAAAVRRARELDWNESRRQRGIGLPLLLQCLADPDPVIYEAYLGARRAKQSYHFDESAERQRIEELLAWMLDIQQSEEGITGALEEEASSLDPVEVRDSDRTGIEEGDPGALPGFEIDGQLRWLVEAFRVHRTELAELLPDEELQLLEAQIPALESLVGASEGELQVLGVDAMAWREHLYRAVARILVARDPRTFAGALLVLCRAAHLEFLRERLEDLGLVQLPEIRAFLETARVEKDQAAAFYQLRVDDPLRDLAIDFFDGRARIAQILEELGSA